MRFTEIKSETISYEPTLVIRFRVVQAENILLEREIEPNENEVVALRDEIVRLTNETAEDVENDISKIVTSARRQRLNGQQQDQEAQDKAPAQSSDDDVQVILFRAIDNRMEGYADRPDEWGIYKASRRLTNFTLVWEEDIEVVDDVEASRIFVGRLRFDGKEKSLQISASDLADGRKFQAAIYESLGPEVFFNATMKEVALAVSILSQADSDIKSRQRTTNSGWNGGGSAFLVPGGCITANGLSSADSQLTVDLSNEQEARHLDMQSLSSDELNRVKRHIVQDLLPLHDRQVTYSLLGACAAAVLYNFAPGAGRFALWLVGLTGAGKSFLSKLFMNLFGDFPVTSGRFVTWSSTANAIQRTGYFFKDALYLVDDYKPEVIQLYNIVRILQTYADGTARGRLKSDATSNITRPIRGLLLCTGEDIPQHTASAVARSIVVQVPQQKKDTQRGARCVSECKNYSGVTADFIRWLIGENRTGLFAARYQVLMDQFYTDVQGEQNDARIASNLALLAAGFEQFAEYLGDVWPQWQAEVKCFLEVELVTIRDEMLGEAKEQQASEIFLSTLRELKQAGRVELASQVDYAPVPKANVDLIGRKFSSVPLDQIDLNRNNQAPGYAQISMKLALRAVNRFLEDLGRPKLVTSERTLIGQLREAGKLLIPNENSKPKTAPLTARIGGKQVRVFTIDMRELDYSTDDSEAGRLANRRNTVWSPAFAGWE